MIDPLRLELLAWIAREPRSYRETIDVWKTHCPRQSLWEDALGEGLVRVVRNGAESQVSLTQLGEGALAASAPPPVADERER